MNLSSPNNATHCRQPRHWNDPERRRRQFGADRHRAVEQHDRRERRRQHRGRHAHDDRPDAGDTLHLHPGRGHRLDRQRLVHDQRHQPADGRALRLRGQVAPTRSASARTDARRPVLREGLHHHGHQRQRDADRHRAVERHASPRTSRRQRRGRHALAPPTRTPATRFTYTLVAGTGSTDNASFTISGSQLQTTARFDFETKPPTRSASASPTRAACLREAVHDHGHERQRGADRHRAVDQHRRREPAGRHASSARCQHDRSRRRRHASPTPWSPAPARPTTRRSPSAAPAEDDGVASTSRRRATYSIRVRTTDQRRPVLREGLHDHRHQRQRGADGHRAVERRASPRTSRRERRSARFSDDRSGRRRHVHLHPGRAAPARPTTRRSPSAAPALQTAASLRLRDEVSPTRPRPGDRPRRPVLREGLHDHGHQRQRDADRHRAVAHRPSPRTSRRPTTRRHAVARPIPTPATRSPTRSSPAPARPTTALHDQRQPAADDRVASTSRRKLSYTSASAPPTAAACSSSKAFTITVTNVNETPTDIALVEHQHRRERRRDTTVGTSRTTDPDAGDTLHLHPRARHRLDRQRLVHDQRQPAPDDRVASTSRRKSAPTRSASASPTRAACSSRRPSRSPSPTSTRRRPARTRRSRSTRTPATPSPPPTSASAIRRRTPSARSASHPERCRRCQPEAVRRPR